MDKGRVQIRAIGRIATAGLDAPFAVALGLLSAIRPDGPGGRQRFLGRDAVDPKRPRMM